MLEQPRRLPDGVAQRRQPLARRGRNFRLLAEQFTLSQHGERVLKLDEEEQRVVGVLPSEQRRRLARLPPQRRPVLGGGVDGIVRVVANLLDHQPASLHLRQLLIAEPLPAERLDELKQPPLAQPFHKRRIAQISSRRPFGAFHPRAKRQRQRDRASRGESAARDGASVGLVRHPASQQPKVDSGRMDSSARQTSPVAANCTFSKPTSREMS